MDKNTNCKSRKNNQEGSGTALDIAYKAGITAYLADFSRHTESNVDASFLVSLMPKNSSEYLEFLIEFGRGFADVEKSLEFLKVNDNKEVVFEGSWLPLRCENCQFLERCYRRLDAEFNDGFVFIE